MNAPPPPPGPVRSDADLRAAVPFDFIRYAGCWEDADILCEALDCECVQVIGRKFVLFKQKKKESAYTAVLAK